MKKYPRSQVLNLLKKGAAFLFVAEVGLFGGIYHVYHRMNTDRDYRYYMKNNYSYCLEAFYSVGEFMNSRDKTRHLDECENKGEGEINLETAMATLKIMYYLGGFTVVGYFLMKVVERDPESLRKELPERNQVDYEGESQKRNAAFMQILKNAAAGDNPEEAVKKLKSEMEKTSKTS